MQNIGRALRAVALILLVLAVQGCATSGARFSEMAQVKQAPAAGLARIYVYRTSVLGAAIQPSVKLNGQTIGDAVPQGFFFVDRPAGDYTISTETEVDRTLSLTLEPGQVRYVRLGISMGFFVGHVYPEIVEPAEGSKDIQDCHYIGDKP